MTAPDPSTSEPTSPEPAATEPEVAEARRFIPVWALPLLIGVVTITAGVFTWRAGQLGSSAAFQDRQAVGQTITQQEQATEVNLAAIGDAVAYVRYVADFAEAAAFDAVAPDLQDQGATSLAAAFTEQADALRLRASDLAVAAGVFGEQTILSQIAATPDEPLDFDLEAQIEALRAQVATGIDSPGVPDPDTWAAKADDTRSRVRALRLATLALLGVVVAFTVAQLTDRPLTRRLGASLGSAAYVAVVVLTLTTVF